jgi:DNA-binding NarL/FixJ family response regulator
VKEGSDVTLMVVDTHRMFVEAVVRVLDAEPGLRVVATATSAAEAADIAADATPDIVILDQSLLDQRGTDLVARLLETGGQVVLLTSDESDAVLLDAIRAGCAGYVLKSGPYDELVASVRAVSEGEDAMPSHRLIRLYADGNQEPVLTPREIEVLGLVADGLASKEIAVRLGLALNTVRNHVQRVNEKLGVRNKTAAVAVATRQGLIRR